MLSVPTIADQQIDDFHRDGFVLLPGAFGSGEMGQIENWTQEITALPEESGKHWVFHEKSLKHHEDDLICRIEKITQFHDGFKELSNVLKAPTAQLLGEPADLFKEKINFKMPGGDGFTPHQDSQAGWETYASYFITVMVCIDEATTENGCLKMAAGHHKKGLMREWEPLNDGDMKEMNFVDMPTNTGDIAFFDSYAPHRSEPNMSGRIRRLYFATYNKASEGSYLEAYYADKFDSYPPDIDRDADKDYVFRV